MLTNPPPPVSYHSGHVILWDDGTIGNLPRLAKLRSISGQFILYGAPIAVVKASEGGKPGGKYLVNLQGLESLEVRGNLGKVLWQPVEWSGRSHGCGEGYRGGQAGRQIPGQFAGA